MRVEDLRIGNLVNYDMLRMDAPQIIEISIKDLDFIDMKSEDRYTPIPLTEDLLVKLDFVKLSEGWCHREVDSIERDNQRNQLNYSDGKFYIDAPCAHDGYFEVECEYVHQLQNLYFCLTDEELTIKEPT